MGTEWGSVEEILAAGGSPEPMATLGVSGASLERITVDGTPLVVKRLDPHEDWSMHALGHLSDPSAGMREARRTAARLLSASFDDTWTHPAKAAVDEILRHAGYRPPAWYTAVKHDATVEHPKALRQLASRAGFTSVALDRLEVDTGLNGADELADWRLGMAQVARFTSSLDSVTRAQVRCSVEAALEGMPPLVIPVLVLTAS